MRLRERRPVPGGPYALATTDDGIVRTSLVQAGALHRSDSGTLVEFGTGSRPMLVVGEGGVVHVSRGDDTISTGSASGPWTDVRLPAGTEPYGLAVTPEGLWFAGLGDVVGRIPSGAPVEVVELPAGTMPGPLAADPDGDGVWGTCFGADALLRWRVGSAPELLPLGGGPGTSRGPVGLCADDDGVRWAEITSGTLGLLREGGSVDRVALPATPSARRAPRRTRRHVRHLLGRRRLAHVAADGTVTALGLTPGDEPHGLCRDRDGNVRVALESGFVAVVAPHGGACGLRVRTGRG